MQVATSSGPFAQALQQDYPEIEATVRVLPEGGGLLSAGDVKIQTDEVVFADSTFFNVFTFPLVAGNTATALMAPNTVVLTKSLAGKLFRDPEAALGKSVTWDQETVNLVTGVMEDVPQNSHMRFAAVRSMPAGYTTGLQTFNLYTYLLLRPGADVEKLRSRLPEFYDRHLKADMGEGVNYHVELQPITSIHLYSNLSYEFQANGNARVVYIFAMVALLILLIACINYMNISTARSSVRVREVGVRKSLGSEKGQIARLFLTESVLLTLIAAVFAAILTSLALPVFNRLTGKPLGLWNYGVGYTLLALLGFSLFTGLLAGSWPAFFMSSFKTINALKGRLSSRLGNAGFRKVLVSFQFVVAIVLIAATIVTWRQLQYVNGKNLGFNKDQVLTFPLHDPALRSRIPALREQLLKSPFIESVAAASNPMGNNRIGTRGFRVERNGKFDEDASLLSQNFMIDEEFLKTLDIPLVKGRNFSMDRPGERYTAILINETMAKEFGLKDPIGARVQFRADTVRERRIIGVVKDFHLYSLQHKIMPVAMMMPPVAYMEDNLYVRLNNDHIPEGLRHVEKVYAEFEKNYPIAIHFLDENFSQQYHSEQLQGKIFMIFTGLAIFIACLGLFGLAAFTAEQRTKEIGVRKVLGASVANITGMLSKDFLKLVLIAAVLAVPLAWWAMRAWLNDFAYRISLAWWMFAAAAILAFIIALATVGYQAVRAALANPSDSLRAE